MALVLFLVVASAARAELTIEKIQPAYGKLGPLRKSLTVTAGDEIYFTFDIAGMQTDGDGKVDGTIRAEITDAEGKSLLKKDNPLRGLLALGGGRLSGMANVTFGAGAKPGEYPVTVTVTDRLSGEKATFQRKVLYQSGGFHIVSPQFFFDADGKLPAPAGGFVGQSLFLHLKAVGLDPQAERVDAAMTLQILDSNGKAMLPKPLVAVLSENDSENAKKIQLLTFNANFSLNRAGNFTLQVEVRDRVGKAVAKFTTPLRALPLAVME